MSKRNVDEMNMFGNDDLSANGADGDLDMDAKKVKLDAPSPSRVLHIRNVPSDSSESEIIQLGLPFGKMTNMLLIRNKNQALLEMADVASAQTMVNYYSNRLPQIRGRPVYVQYSRHDQLKTTLTSQNTGAQAALQAAQQLMNNVGEGNVVLHVSVEHMIYPVTIDVLKQIFQKFGQVLKIITFTKNNLFQALIQFADPVSTQAARVALNGQNIYDGCCTLRIDLSKLTNLNVKFNNDHSRDFTNPMLPSGANDNINQRSGAGLFGSGPGLAGRMPAELQGMRGGMGDFNRNGGGMSGNMMQNIPSFAAATNNFGMNQPQGPQGSPVVLVSNLNEEKATPDALFVLFGVYGDVVRVKILFKKKDNALVQFTDTNMARTAIMHLDRVELWDKKIKVAPSKHMSIQIPKEGQEDAGLTKDYTGSPLHRFRNPNSKNFMNIFPPSATLHLFNIPANASEDDIKDLFSNYGTVVNYRVFQKDRRMAQLEMGSVSEAIEALVALHNYKIGDQSHLKVSFSKGTIS